MSDNFRHAAIFHGFDFNAYDGAYENGKSYGHEKKIEVATSLIAAMMKSILKYVAITRNVTCYNKDPWPNN